MRYDKFVEGTSHAPCPFPGKYPTRVSLQSTNDKVKFRYDGKLTPAILRTVRASYIRKGGDFRRLYLYEFDQNGQVNVVTGGNRTVAATFFPIYYPIPPLLHGLLGRQGQISLFLDRVIATVEGKQIYKNPTLMKGPWREEYADLLGSFTNAQLEDVADAISGEARDFFSMPFVTTKKPGPPQPRPVDDFFERDVEGALIEIAPEPTTHRMRMPWATLETRVPPIAAQLWLQQTQELAQAPPPDLAIPNWGTANAA